MNFELQARGMQRLEPLTRLEAQKPRAPEKRGIEAIMIVHHWPASSSCQRQGSTTSVHSPGRPGSAPEASVDTVDFKGGAFKERPEPGPRVPSPAANVVRLISPGMTQ